MGDEVPLDPDGGTARRLLARELARPAYADRRSLLQRAWDWGRDRLEEILHGAGSALPLSVLIPLLVALALLLAYAVSRLRGPVAARATAEDHAVLADVRSSARDLLARADAQRAQGAYSAAFVDYFRAIARRSEERDLLLARPGRTAREVAAQLAPYFPARSEQLREAATHFDRVRYGGSRATAADVDRIQRLQDDLAGARPEHRSPGVLA